MAVFHKDWEQPNSRIWLAEIGIESGLDFPIFSHHAVKMLQTKL